MNAGAVMTHDEFCRAAGEYGFRKVFFLPPDAVPLADNPHHLVTDPKAEFPYAASIAVMVFPYAPFTAEERIPAYYLASNAAYFGMKALLRRLNGQGIRADKAEIPLKAALDRAGIGTPLRNSLRAIRPFGSRFVLMSIAVEGIPPLEYPDEALPSPCGNCRACENACPAGAIGRDGLDLARCMRPRMETADHPDDIRDRQRTYIGCEICQYACPMNAKLEKAELPAEAVEAFDLTKLLRGDAAKARALVGKNMTGNGKLTAEALAFAARDGLLTDESLDEAIALAEASPFAAVRSAARYARNKLSSRTSR